MSVTAVNFGSDLDDIEPSDEELKAIEDGIFSDPEWAAENDLVRWDEDDYEFTDPYGE